VSPYLFALELDWISAQLGAARAEEFPVKNVAVKHLFADDMSVCYIAKHTCLFPTSVSSNT